MQTKPGMGWMIVASIFFFILLLVATYAMTTLNNSLLGWLAIVAAMYVPILVVWLRSRQRLAIYGWQFVAAFAVAYVALAGAMFCSLVLQNYVASTVLLGAWMFFSLVFIGIKMNVDKQPQPDQSKTDALADHPKADPLADQPKADKLKQQP